MSCVQARVGYEPLANVRWYKKLQARLVGHGSESYERKVHVYKERLFGSLRGRILEVGAGGGINLRHLDPGVEYVGLEPNEYSLLELRKRAQARGLAHADAVLGAAEQLPFDDRSFDAVFCSLVFCTVHDVESGLAEIRRVLKPGGRFAFVEHVGAPKGTALRRIQRGIRPVWEVLGDGCHPDRDTAAAIRAAGFDRVDLEELRLHLPVVGTHIAGQAWKAAH
ncbi:class I SAM-dependent methyltransferase [Vulgatibacter sp.]|uniref:class I SAM-dependent methyltransferase n=1 Tax=Vulgatibacter sp. TaxID=1971226 RepID=UPI003569E122